jgi:endonuclease/exonuclease/phosphatase family metal-dependent hydrolase
VGRAGGTIALVALLFAVALTGCDDKSTTSNEGRSTRRAVTVVAQNLLHGIACPADTDRCKLPQRVELFARQLVEAKCPEVVSVEESDPVMAGLLKDQAREICAGHYDVVGADDPSIDREVVLTTLPVLAHERTRLSGPLRTALWVRVAAALGPLDVVATHLASGSDDRPCDSETCPPPCHDHDTLNTCQGRQAAAVLASHLMPESVGVLVGDLNAKPRDPTINALRARGFIDTYVAAKQPPCDPATGTGCTSGRQDADLSDLTNPHSHETERIDFVMLKTARECSVATSSGLFAADPASPPLDGLVFASDHTGAQATISCVTTARDLAEARPDGAVTSTTTTTAPAKAVDPETGAAVTKSFETVFNGGGAIESRLRSLQDADRLRESFIARFEDPATRDVVDQVTVRIDSMSAVDEDHVNVVYSILLGSASVLDHLAGEAVRESGQWLVSRRSYCQVATLGQATVPAACR